MKLELDEFVEATGQLHRRSGVKRTRMLIRLRPNARPRRFVVKCTDGNTTYTTHIRYLDELKTLQRCVNDFVSHCTSASVPPPAQTPPSPAASALGGAANQADSASSPSNAAAATNNSSKQGGGGSTNQSANRGNANKKAAKAKKGRR